MSARTDIQTDVLIAKQYLLLLIISGVHIKGQKTNIIYVQTCRL